MCGNLARFEGCREIEGQFEVCQLAKIVGGDRILKTLAQAGRAAMRVAVGNKDRWPDFSVTAFGLQSK